MPSQRRNGIGGVLGFATILALLATTVLLWGLPVRTDVAHAHGLSVFAWVEGGRVHVESKFSGGRRPKGAAVEVYDAQGRKLLEGRTDDQGRFSFDAPAAAELKIVLQGGTGHRAEWIVRKSDFSADAGDAALPSDPPTPVETGAPKTLNRTSDGLSAAEVEAIVERVVEKKMAPIRKILADSHTQGPTLHDIIGGIGYILGLVGLAAYIGYRRKK